MSDFDKYVKNAQRAVTDVGEGFTKPDDDWMPVLLLETPDGSVIVAMAVDKKDFPKIARQMVVKQGATWGAAVLSSWSAEAGTPEMIDRIYDEYGSLENYPLRKEILLLDCADASGRHETWKAPILRSDDAPPTLGEWEKAGGPLTSGRLADIMTGAFTMTDAG